MTPDELSLKWGTLKSWHMKSAAGIAALAAYDAGGPVSPSAMRARDTPAQKQAICDMIDAVHASGGAVWDDWNGCDMTAEGAKRYVMDYGQ